MCTPPFLLTVDKAEEEFVYVPPAKGEKKAVNLASKSVFVLN